MIAFIIMATGVVFVGVIMGSSLRNVDNARYRVVATNVARQGVEAMRNIRDTNWLRFNGKRRLCWNHLPGLNLTDPCNGNSPIAPGDYVIYRQDGTLQWRLFSLADPAIQNFAQPPANPALGSYYRNTSDNSVYYATAGQWDDVSKLYLVDIDVGNDSNGDGDSANDPDLYNHLYPRGDNAAGTESGSTLMKRIIRIEYLDNTGNIIDSAGWAAANKADLNRMRVTSIVTWIRGANTFSVELSTHLTDYLGREKLAG